MLGLTEENVLANTIQGIKDLLYGGLTQRNMKSIRTFFVVNAQDSLDHDYPMYVPFSIPADTVKVVSVYVKFWQLPFRAYSKAAASSQQLTTAAGGSTSVTSSSGGGQTTSDGGAVTTTSGSGGALTTASGGGTTTSSGGGTTSSTYNYGTKTSGTTATSANCYVVNNWVFVTNVGSEKKGGLLPTELNLLRLVPDTHTHNVVIGSHSHTIGNHTHSVSAHTHLAPAHTHTVSIASHTHTVSNHSHNVTIGDHIHTISPHSHNINFGIYEENRHPTTTLYVSRDNGATYPYRIGSYSENQELIEITQYVDSPGGKMLKFESTDLGRLSVQIEIKVDISK